MYAESGDVVAGGKLFLIGYSHHARHTMGRVGINRIGVFSPFFPTKFFFSFFVVVLLFRENYSGEQDTINRKFNITSLSLHVIPYLLFSSSFFIYFFSALPFTPHSAQVLKAKNKKKTFSLKLQSTFLYLFEMISCDFSRITASKQCDRTGNFFYIYINIWCKIKIGSTFICSISIMMHKMQKRMLIKKIC